MILRGIMEWGLDSVAMLAKPSRELGGLDPIARLLKDLTTSTATRLPPAHASSPHPLVLAFTACHNHVATVRCQVCDEEVVAQQLDEAIGKLVHQRSGLQAARTEVRIFFCGQWLLWVVFG